MKKVILIFVFIVLLVPTVLAAQQSSVQVSRFGLFLAPVLKLTGIGDQVETMVGLRGAVIIGDWFSIGLGAYSLVSEFKVDADGSFEDLNFRYGGLEQDIIFLSDSLVHGVFRLLIGAGSASLGDAVSGDSFFVAEIGGDAEVNLTDWMRLSAGGGWRMVQGVEDIEGVFNKDLSGFYANIAVKMGVF